MATLQRTTVYISAELHARLRGHALATGTSMSKLVELYCWEGLYDDEGPGATSPAAGPSQPTN